MAEFDIKILAAYVSLALDPMGEGIAMGGCPKCWSDDNKAAKEKGFLNMVGSCSWNRRKGNIWLECDTCGYSETLYEGEIRPLEFDK